VCLIVGQAVNVYGVNQKAVRRMVQVTRVDGLAWAIRPPTNGNRNQLKKS